MGNARSVNRLRTNRRGDDVGVVVLEEPVDLSAALGKDLWVLRCVGVCSLAVVAEDNAAEETFVFRVSEGGEVVQRTSLSPKPNLVSRVQILSEGAVLLLCVAVSRIAALRHSTEALLYSSEGALVRTFSLGEGITDVQATPSDLVWVSYSDEGIFGDDPRGSCAWPATISVATLCFSLDRTMRGSEARSPIAMP